MNKPIKVLIADDSAVIRRLLRETLVADPDLEVVKAVANGRSAVEYVKRDAPDVIVLDIEMPEMNGVEATREIRKFNSVIPIIIFSSLTTAGGRATLDALSAGANDCIAKPANCGRLELAIKQLESELIPAIKEQVAVPATASVATQPTPDEKPQADSGDRQAMPILPPKLVVVGVSTGGPAALAVFLKQLPASFPVPILIVQHMPPTFTKLLAERLDKGCALSVAEATHNSIAQPGNVFIAPGSEHLRVAQSGRDIQLHLDDGQPENSCRPSVDVLFRSAAMAFGNRVVGVVLTGMGKDGLEGARNLRDAESHIIAQDEVSSVVWGMPGEVVRNGLANQELPLERIARVLTQIVSPTKAQSIQ